MTWKWHPVNQNANIAVNESHRNRRKRRIVKNPDHLNKCRLGGLQFSSFSWNKHTRDDLAAMLNLHYVTWSGIGQSDIFRQWKQQQVRLRSDSKVWSEFTLVLLVIAFFAVTNIFSAGMWSLRFSFFRSCVFHYMRCTIIISKNETSERVPRCSTFRLCVSV